MPLRSGGDLNFPHWNELPIFRAYCFRPGVSGMNAGLGCEYIGEGSNR